MRYYHLIPLVFTAATASVFAADTMDEQQRLQGYGQSLYGSLFHTDASYSPLGDSVDRQLSLAAYDHWSDIQMGGGRRTLWQDPEHGLVNAIASYLHRDSEQFYRFGAEGEWYHGALTASGRAGYLTATGQPGYLYNYDNYGSQPFAGVDLRWYATENLSFQIGGEQIDNKTLGNVRLEYQPSMDDFNGLSFFARAAGGSEDNEYVLGGVRYSFGESPSLIHRDRGNPGATALDRLSPTFQSLHYNNR